MPDKPNPEQLRAQLAEIIKKQTGYEGPLKDETTFEEAGADSLDKIELVIEVEEEFEIEITDDETEALETLADVEKLIQEKLSE